MQIAIARGGKRFLVTLKDVRTIALETQHPAAVLQLLACTVGQLRDVFMCPVIVYCYFCNLNHAATSVT